MSRRDEVTREWREKIERVIVEELNAERDVDASHDGTPAAEQGWRSARFIRSSTSDVLDLGYDGSGEVLRALERLVRDGPLEKRPRRAYARGQEYRIQREAAR
jgi:hypothetical protein